VTESADQSETKLICVCFLHHSQFYRNCIIGFTVYLHDVYREQNDCSCFLFAVITFLKLKCDRLYSEMQIAVFALVNTTFMCEISFSYV